MRLQSLIHLTSVVRALASGERVIVLGSSSLLASFPEMGEAGEPLETSFDADLLVEGCDEELAGFFAEAVGEASLFSAREGYHADVMRDAIKETLPPGCIGSCVNRRFPPFVMLRNLNTLGLLFGAGMTFHRTHPRSA